MEAASNTSPLIFLARLPALLPVVARLFDRVWVPQPVVREAVEAALASTRDDVRQSGSQVQELLRHAIFKVAEAPTPLAGLPQGLGEGERATLALALAKRLQWVLLDDRPASRIARRLGLGPYPSRRCRWSQPSGAGWESTRRSIYSRHWWRVGTASRPLYSRN